ncbi:MAG: hypothetical protein JKY15_05010 [Deltaproteobacteria bacterium]|nr:hypothetical protein [Deltaproteobacteria bacterium]
MRSKSKLISLILSAVMCLSVPAFAEKLMINEDESAEQSQETWAKLAKRHWKSITAASVGGLFIIKIAQRIMSRAAPARDPSGKGKDNSKTPKEKSDTETSGSDGDDDDDGNSRNNGAMPMIDLNFGSGLATLGGLAGSASTAGGGNAVIAAVAVAAGGAASSTGGNNIARDQTQTLEEQLAGLEEQVSKLRTGDTDIGNFAATIFSKTGIPQEDAEAAICQVLGRKDSGVASNNDNDDDNLQPRLSSEQQALIAWLRAHLNPAENAPALAGGVSAAGGMPRQDSAAANAIVENIVGDDDDTGGMGAPVPSNINGNDGHK